MQYSDDRYRMRVEITPKECNLPADELTRMQGLLDPLGEAVQDFPSSDLTLTIVNHPRSQAYHVEARLKVPGKSLFSSDADPYLDCAFQRCVNKLLHRIDAYKENPDAAAAEQTRQRERLDNDVVAPEAPDAGPLGQAVEAGDYRAFRTAMSGYEEWLRKRVGRWIQRYPDAEARVGRDLLIGDLIEEVYLNAFEGFTQRPTDIRLSEWLDRLIDPSLKVLLRDVGEEKDAIRYARTLRETSPGQS